MHRERSSTAGKKANIAMQARRRAKQSQSSTVQQSKAQQAKHIKQSTASTQSKQSKAQPSKAYQAKLSKHSKQLTPSNRYTIKTASIGEYNEGSRGRQWQYLFEY